MGSDQIPLEQAYCLSSLGYHASSRGGSLCSQDWRQVFHWRASLYTPGLHAHALSVCRLPFAQRKPLASQLLKFYLNLTLTNSPSL